MKKSKTAIVLISAIAMVGLTGCDMIEQAKDSAVEKTKQSAGQALDGAKQKVDGLLGKSGDKKPAASEGDGDEKDEKESEKE